MSDIVERLRDYAKDDHERGCSGRYYDCHCGYDDTRDQLIDEAAARIEKLEAALDTVRASGLLIGSTTLHDRVRSAVYNAIDANPAALEEAPCSSS